MAVTEQIAEISGARIGIVHYGERVPNDPGYVPGRMGVLAAALTKAGAEVTRFAPTYSQIYSYSRSLEGDLSTSKEGTVRLIQARPYTASLGFDRLMHLRDFIQGTAKALSDAPDFDALIVGYPPPGMVAAISRATDRKIPILADIRDLWPDALVPTDREIAARTAGLVGRGMANELRLAAGVVAMSELMLKRAPVSRRRAALCLSMADVIHSDHETPVGPLQALFVGTFTQGVDFQSLIGGWNSFVSSSPAHQDAALRICGRGPKEDVVAKAAAASQGVNLVGWVPSDEVAGWMARSDIGVAPTRAGFGTTLNNKALEYLSSGLFVLNSLDQAVQSKIEELGLASHVDASTQGWAAAFSAAADDLDSMRAGRRERIEVASSHFGRSHIEKQWFDQLRPLLSA